MRYRNARQVCPRCNHGWTGDIPSTVMRLQKVRLASCPGISGLSLSPPIRLGIMSILHLQVDFYWINRDQRSFEWFVSLLSQLEIEQSEQCGFDHFLDMHMYMTAALKKTDVKAIGTSGSPSLEGD